MSICFVKELEIYISDNHVEQIKFQLSTLYPYMDIVLTLIFVILGNASEHNVWTGWRSVCCGK